MMTESSLQHPEDWGELYGGRTCISQGRRVEVCAGLFFKSRSREVISHTRYIYTLCSPAVRLE